MQEKDYIKLYRSFLEWEWYSDINTSRLFLHMILKANWKEGKFQGTTVPRGSFISSYNALSCETKLTVDEIRTSLKKLERTKEVTKQITNKYTVFTVVNYDLYQDSPKQDTTQVPSESQTIPNPFPTIEEKKEGKKERSKKEVPDGTKKKIPLVYFDDDGLNTAFAEFVAYRQELKKPMTDKAITLAIKKLTEFSVNPAGELDKTVATEILEQSVLNNWTGIFPLKTKSRQGNAEKIDWERV